MKKRMRAAAFLLTALVFLTLIFSVLPSSALAAEGDTGIDGIWNYTELSDGTVEVTHPAAPLNGAYLLPDTLGGKVVTQIAYGAFQSSASLISITLPSTLKIISAYAFDGCTGLTSIAIPDSVTQIGDNAFRGCTNLQTVTLPSSANSSLISIGQGTFAGCTKLTSITIPDTVTSIGPTAFFSCTGLTTATLPSNPAFTTIPVGMFNTCSGLSSIVIPDSVTTIGAQAFTACGLSSIAIPANVVSIGLLAFTACPNMTEIEVDQANTQYKSVDGVLYDIDLQTLIVFPAGRSGAFTVPESVATISQQAFLGCQNLTQVTLPENLQIIGEYSFAFSGITRITLPESIVLVGYCAFRHCPGLTKAVFLGKTSLLGGDVFTDTAIGDNGIYGFVGSTVQTYANNNSIPFYPLYTVSFESNGGSAVSDVVVEPGNTLTAPAAPTQAGYTFSGWYEDTALTSLWDFSTDTVTDDTTLYAAWEAEAEPTAAPTPMPTVTPSATAAPVPAATPILQITASPADGRIYLGGRIALLSNISGGTWSYDKSFLSQDGNSFEALKAGTVRVTYTVGSQSAYVDIIITKIGVPQTGDALTAALWLPALAVCIACAALALRKKAQKNELF